MFNLNRKCQLLSKELQLVHTCEATKSIGQLSKLPLGVHCLHWAYTGQQMSGVPDYLPTFVFLPILPLCWLHLQRGPLCGGQTALSSPRYSSYCTTLVGKWGNSHPSPNPSNLSWGISSHRCSWHTHPLTKLWRGRGTTPWLATAWPHAHPGRAVESTLPEGLKRGVRKRIPRGKSWCCCQKSCWVGRIAHIHHKGHVLNCVL